MNDDVINSSCKHTRLLATDIMYSTVQYMKACGGRGTAPNPAASLAYSDLQSLDPP